MEYSKMKSLLFYSVFICFLFGKALLLGNSATNATDDGLERNSNTNSGCNVTIRSQYGFIRSPNYPNKYPRYSRCRYVVERFSKDVCEVKLTMDWFEVEKMAFTQCSEDFFEIQNGDKHFKLCGELPPGSKKFVFFPTNSDKLVFKFSSTFHQKKGFSIEVKQLPFSCVGDPNKTQMASTRISSCSQTVSSRVGRITFPDEDYPSDSCTYTIQRSEPQACLLQLDFISFDVTESSGCLSNHLLLPDGQKMCGILGGTRKFVPFDSDNEEIILTFKSSENSNPNSFDIEVTQMPGPCEGGLTPNITGSMGNQCDQTVWATAGTITSPGFPGFFGPNYFCTYRIYRPDLSVCQLELDFIVFSLGRHNPPSCSSGAFLELPGRNRLCHDILGKMTIKVSEFQDPVIFEFHSDSSTSGRGFHIQVTQIPNTCPGFTGPPHLPKSIRRCYQEVSTYSGYFSPSLETSTCEFVIWRADPTVCKVRLQVTASMYLSVPCMYNFIELPDGLRMCASVTERREIEFPTDLGFLSLNYYNIHNPMFNLWVDQEVNSCKTLRSSPYVSKHKRWAWKIIPR